MSAVDETAGAGARWPVLAGVWGVYFSFGMVAASMAPLVGEIRADIDLNNAAMGLILGAWPIAYIAMAIPCGLALDRIGARRMLVLAAVVMAASAAARGLAETPLTLFLAVALFGVGGPMISVGAPVVIARLYEGPARATAMGLYVTGPYLGSLLALAITHSVLMPLADGNWRWVMAMHAGLALVTGALWALVSGLRAQDLSPRGDGKKYDLGAFAEILGQREVQLILAVAVGIFFLNHGFNNWLPEILIAAGYAPRAAGFWAAFPAAVGILGVLVIPRLAPAERRLVVLAALIGGVLVASLLLLTGAPGPLVAGLMLLGLARGSMMTLAIMLLMETPGIPQERLGLAGGMFFTAAEVGGVLGPVTFGALAHVSGGFAAPLLTVTALCLGLLIPLALLNGARRV